MNLNNLIEQRLLWIPVLNGDGILKYEGSVIGTLRYDNDKSFFKNLFPKDIKVIAETANGIWTFKYIIPYLLYNKHDVYIQLSGVSCDIAVFKRRTSADVLVFPDGRKYPLIYLPDDKTAGNFSGYKFTTEKGEDLITYIFENDLMNEVLSVTIHSAAAQIPEMPWMVMLGLFEYALLNYIQ